MKNRNNPGGPEPANDGQDEDGGQTKPFKNPADPHPDKAARAESRDGVNQPTGHGPEVPPDLNPFDPARLRLDQAYVERTGVKKQLITVPVRKPLKEEFVRTHPDLAYRLPTGLIELKGAREVYLVNPSLWPGLATERTFGPKLLVTAVTRQGVLFLWPIRLPGPDGKLDDWSRSALEAAKVARDSWVRVQANSDLGAYEVMAASAAMAVPEFPDITMAEILKIAFKDKYVDGKDHPTLRKLRGEL